MQIRRDQLAVGLIRLNAELGERAPSEHPALPMHSPAQMQQDGTDTRISDAFSHLIGTMAIRTTLWADDRLQSASSGLRSGAVARQEDAFFYTNLRMMNIISHAIEERVIADDIDCEVYTGFQRLALLKTQLPRYRALVEHAEYVYVYGIDDVPKDSPVAQFQHPHLIRFAIDPRLHTGMEWFWFVVVDHPRLRTALLAQHTGGDMHSHKQSDRTYSGIWTFDRALIAQIVALLRQAGRVLYYNTPNR